MGTSIDNSELTELDYLRFRERLETSLSVLGGLLERPGFGAGPATVGAEAELFVIDATGKPLPRNTDICTTVGDRRVTLELNRCNLELNSSPTLLAGRPFSVLEGELNLLLDRVADVASGCGGRLALIGILPTLQRADLTPGMMTDQPRYRALGDGLRRLRRSPFRIRISGADPLDVTSEDVALEGANTSFQVHLRVAPGDFTATYNAAQLASAPALAAGCPYDLPPGRLVTGLLGVVEPPLNVLPGWACVVARRQPVKVDRPLGAPRTGPVGQARPYVQGDGERLLPLGPKVRCQWGLGPGQGARPGSLLTAIQSPVSEAQVSVWTPAPITCAVQILAVPGGPGARGLGGSSLRGRACFTLWRRLVMIITPWC